MFSALTNIRFQSIFMGRYHSVLVIEPKSLDTCTGRCTIVQLNFFVHLIKSKKKNFQILYLIF